MSGGELRDEQALQAPVQGSGLDYNYVHFKIVIAAVILVRLVVAAMLSMYPGRRLGPQLGWTTTRRSKQFVETYRW